MCTPLNDNLHPIQGLYVITDTNLLTHDNLINSVRKALEGGAKVVQFRDKISSPEEKLKSAKALQKLCKSYQACFIVNDDIELAKTVKADGVHIGKEDEDISKARKQLGKEAIIGVSCYNDLERAKTMQKLEANYVAFGRFFVSKTKPNAPQANMDTLAKAKQHLNIPIVAIGGITKDNAQSLIDAGADSIAVIQGVFAQEDIQTASLELQNLFD